MQRYWMRRVLATLPTVIGVLVVAFSLLFVLPGDPVDLLASRSTANLGPEALEAARDSLGLNDPVPVQFVNYVGDVVQGDFGRSILQGRPVSTMIAEALPHTIRLAVAALVISFVLGVTLGALSAVRRSSFLDRSAIVVSLIGVSVPEFWLGMIAILVFSVHLGWFPTVGIGWNALVLPAAVLGVRQAASLARMTRSSMLDVLGSQYVLVARAKGLGPLTVVVVHALKNAFIPVVTLLGLELGRLIGAAVVVETIFARPGIGSVLINSILDKDVTLMRGAILVVALSYVVINLLVDLSYGWLDPRIRAGAPAQR